jgi:hypothetical protein
MDRLRTARQHVYRCLSLEKRVEDWICSYSSGYRTRRVADCCGRANARVCLCGQAVLRFLIIQAAGGVKHPRITLSPVIYSAAQRRAAAFEKLECKPLGRFLEMVKAPREELRSNLIPTMSGARDGAVV